MTQKKHNTTSSDGPEMKETSGSTMAIGDPEIIVLSCGQHYRAMHEREDNGPDEDYFDKFNDFINNMKSSKS